MRISVAHTDVWIFEPFSNVHDSIKIRIFALNAGVMPFSQAALTECIVEAAGALLHTWESWPYIHLVNEHPRRFNLVQRQHLRWRGSNYCCSLKAIQMSLTEFDPMSCVIGWLSGQRPALIGRLSGKCMWKYFQEWAEHAFHAGAHEPAVNLHRLLQYDDLRLPGQGVLTGL